MSSINSTTMQAATNSASQVSDSQKQANKMTLKPDDFITLFLKQMTMQNPMEPMDNSEILSQMADISAISASEQTQDTLKDIQKSISMSLGNTNLLTATNLIGKKVEVPSGVSALVPGEGLSGSVLMTTPGDNIKVTVKNEQGLVVQEIPLGSASSPGLVEFNWNGLKPDGTSYESGYYQISATATVGGKQQQIDTAGAFKVKSVASNPNTGDLILNVDGLGGMGIQDVIKIL